MNQFDKYNRDVRTEKFDLRASAASIGGTLAEIFEELRSQIEELK